MKIIIIEEKKGNVTIFTTIRTDSQFIRKTIDATSKKKKKDPLHVRLLSFGVVQRVKKGRRDENLIKSSRPIPSGCGAVSLRTSIVDGDYRGSSRCTWKLGGKAISWEKGAGVTRPSTCRTSEPLHARTHTTSKPASERAPRARTQARTYV